MYNPIQSILSRIQKDDRKYNILCLPTHEGYATNMSKVGHNFYMLQGENIKSWDFHTKPLPPNHYLIQQPVRIVPNQPIFNFPRGIEFDLILSQERTMQLPFLNEISYRTGLPVIHIDHTMPSPGWTEKTIDRSNTIPVSQRVFITDFNLKAFKGDPSKDRVIPHGIDTNRFRGFKSNPEPYGISVVNLFPQRDVFCGWELWRSVASERKVKLIGHNPGLSESAKSEDHLIEELASARYFLNTSQWSPVPLSMLEAMSVGLPIISTAKQEIPNIIEHGKNGFLANTKDEMLQYIDILSKDLDLATKMGNEARETIVNKFGIDQFIKNWNCVFDETYKKNI